MENIRKKLLEYGEYYAAGWFETPDASLFERHSRALRRYWENVPLPEYHGEILYPVGRPMHDTEIYPANSNMVRNRVYYTGLREKEPELIREILDSPLCAYVSTVPWEHTVAGNMWTHSMPNYERILREGLNGYEARVCAMKDESLKKGLLDVLAGIRVWHGRILEKLCAEGADPVLIERLRRVPFEPARDMGEAVTAWNVAFYLDMCDNLGALAVGLAPYDRGEDVQPLLKQLFRNCDDSEGYSLQVGMRPNRLDIECIRAVRGLRRPMIEFFTDENTDAETLKEAVECVRSGCGQPAFYNRAVFREALSQKLSEILPEDLDRFSGGGCAESMISGYSNVGSLDAGINLLLILEKSLRERLCACDTFEAFYEGFRQDILREVTRVTDAIRESQKLRAEYQPCPMRTLLIDDCIEKELDYNNGGARYMWSVINFAGLINVIDSLLVIKNAVYDTKRMTPRELLEKLDAGDEEFLRAAKRYEKAFGKNDPDTDAFAHEFAQFVFRSLEGKKPYFGSCFLPSSIQFNSYAEAGSGIGATPDGRCSGEALADSLAPIFGKDDKGPTLMLNSVAALELTTAIGTPIVNLTVSPSWNGEVLKGLIMGFFRQGGIQLQISCVSRAMLEDAYRHPENYGNLVVRVGGYSEYFNRLSDELKKKIMERTILE